MASFFKQLSDDMERVAQVLGEGAKIITGESSQMGDGGGTDNAYASDPTATTGGGDDLHVGDSEDAGEIYDDIDGIPDDMYGSPLMGMADSVMSDIMSHQVGPQTPKEHIQAFAAAITWNEPFIQCLIAFHVLVLIAAVALLRKGEMYSRMGFMVFIGIIVRLAERLNDIGANRWKEFATQNYFDGSGIFMGITVCAPLLLVCLFMLISMIREASNLLGDVQQTKMKAQARQKQRKKEKEEEKKKKEQTKDVAKRTKKHKKKD